MSNLNRVVCVGSGPAGLYFAIQLKTFFPHVSIDVFEKNDIKDSTGFGVILSESILSSLQSQNEELHREIIKNIIVLPQIDVFVKGTKWCLPQQSIKSLSRLTLLTLLEEHAKNLGVHIKYSQPIQSTEEIDYADLIVGCDGVHSVIRTQHKKAFVPQLHKGKNRFIWLGATKNFVNFTFYFKQNRHGLWIVHAYQFEKDRSTFVVECSEATWKHAGLDLLAEHAAIHYLETLFSELLQGGTLHSNNSKWSIFTSVFCTHWYDKKTILIGDALHSSHFSTGSGTSLAMDDAHYLAQSLKAHSSIETALKSFELMRKPVIAKKQKSTLQSSLWFENVDAYYQKTPPLELTQQLLTRTKPDFLVCPELI